MGLNIGSTEYLDKIFTDIKKIMWILFSYLNEFYVIYHDLLGHREWISNLNPVLGTQQKVP